MKIGLFAETNNITIDTVRHYMKLGLILPEKRGGHYYFDERCQADLNAILAFKNMGFALNEIGVIFKFNRLGKLTPYQENENYRDFFINKLDSLNREINLLMGYKENLEEKINELANQQITNKRKLGVNLKAVDVLRCNQCGGNLVLADGTIIDNQIIDGKLRCKCGKEYIIESGILYSGTEAESIDFSFEEFISYLTDFIKENEIKFLDNINKGLEWFYKRINFYDLKDKVLLELGSGVGFFLRFIYNDLPEDSLYIAVDHNMQRHKFLKTILERSGYQKNILFICGDFFKIPLKEKSVDILLDQLGTTSYSFNHSDFLLNQVDHFIKDTAYLYGSYTLFKNFSSVSKIDRKYRKNFTLASIKDFLIKLNYKSIADHLSDNVDKDSKYENYFVEGEKIFTYYYFGQR